MADAKTTLEIIIAASNNTAGAFADISGQISNLTGSVESATAPFLALTAGVLAADAALLAMVAGGLTMAVKASGEFSGQFAEITTLFEAAPDQINTFRSDIIAYATDSTKSIEDINGAVYTAISAGYEYSDSLAVVKTAEQLAVGGKADLNASTLLLTSSMNAYGASADEAGDYSDALFIAVKDGLTTIPELASSLARATTTAVAAGVSFDTLLAAVATLTSKGVPTSEAVTYIAAALKGIIKPTTEAAEEAARLGINFDTTSLQSKGLAGFMAELQVKTGGNVESMNKLFGSSEAVNAAMILAGSGAQKFTDTLKDMDAKAGATAVAYGKMVEQFDQINQKLSNNVKALFISIGNEIQGNYSSLIGNVTEIFQRLTTAIGSGVFDSLFASIKTASDKVSAYVEGIAKALPAALQNLDFSELIAAFESLGGSFSGLFDGIDLTTTEGLTKALQAVVNGITALVNVTDGIVTAFTPFFAVLGEITTALLAIDPAWQKGMGIVMGSGAAISVAAASIGVMSLAVKGLAGAWGTMAANPVVLAIIAAGGIGYLIGREVGDAIYNTNQMTGAVKDLSDAMMSSHGASQMTAADFKKVSADTGVAITSMKEFSAAIESGAIRFDDASGKYVAFAGTIRTESQSIAEFKDPLAAIGMVWDDNGKSFVAAGTAGTTAAKGLNDVWLNGIQIQSAAKIAVDKTTTALDDVAKQSKEAEGKMLELASNEHIKSMEFSVQLEIAGIEANSEIIKATLKSIDTAIDSTGNTWSDLWGQLGDLSGIDKINLKSAIDAEEKRRQGAFEQQKKLVDAEIQLIKDKSVLLKKGGSTLNFKFTGADPLSEHIIIELLKKAQVYVTGEGGAMLLGID